MFTGIITFIGNATLNNSILTIHIDDIKFMNEINIGDSICVNGICLTVIKIQCQNSSHLLEFFIMEETLKRAIIGNEFVNIERALKI